MSEVSSVLCFRILNMRISIRGLSFFLFIDKMVLHLQGRLSVTDVMGFVGPEVISSKPEGKNRTLDFILPMFITINKLIE